MLLLLGYNITKPILTSGTYFLNLIFFFLIRVSIHQFVNISVITKIEVLRFKTTEKIYKILESFITICNNITIDDAIVDKTIRICKLHRIKLPDAIIAATASVNNLTLITRNLDDFKKIDELSVINPYDV